MRDQTDSRTLPLLSNRCPRCGELVSFDGNNEAYCAYADCLWNNGENAPAVRPLTIDTQALGSVWLPGYYMQLEAVEVVGESIEVLRRDMEPGLERHLRGLCTAGVEVEEALWETVFQVRERGGLLLLVNA